MYNGKKISVAMATYNGEKFIEEQLLSILNQTVPPDEIIISDDGSKDRTLDIVNNIAADTETVITVLTDNPRHGYCGNFEWALSHTNGDYIFLSDQDDIWMPEKIECIMDDFGDSGKQCVFHDVAFIDENGKHLDGDFSGKFDGIGLKNVLVKIDRSVWLDSAVTAPLAHGMVMCISKELLNDALPFPETDGFHDWWLGFCAVYNDKCWYDGKQLTKYRLHGNNVCGNSAYKGSFISRVKKVLKRAINPDIDHKCRLIEGQAIRAYIAKKANMLDETENRIVIDAAARLCDIGEKEIDAAKSGRIVGAYKLIKLFRTNTYYKYSGTAAFLYQLADILIHSKKTRCKKMENM